MHGEVFRVDLDTENLMMVENNHKVGYMATWKTVSSYFLLQVLWVMVSVEESEQYKMEDRDLVTMAKVSPAMAMLGRTTMVQTPARLVPSISLPKIIKIIDFFQLRSCHDNVMFFVISLMSYALLSSLDPALLCSNL